MLRETPPAAGPNPDCGPYAAAPELHGAVRSGTAVRGPNRDHWPRAGRRSYASAMHISAPPAAGPARVFNSDML